MREMCFEVGDHVSIAKGTMLWIAREDLQGKSGEVAAIVFDGTSLERITVAYDGVIEFTAIYAGIFDRVIQPPIANGSRA